PARLRSILNAAAGRRILVVGDLMLDEFIWGSVSRISPEAPVPIVKVTGESYYPGGAANVARNVQELTGRTAIIGLAGDDPQGGRLLDLLGESGIDTSYVIRAVGRSTIVKTRIIARNQQIVRVDRERPAPLTAEQTGQAIAALNRAIPEAHAIVVAD